MEFLEKPGMLYVAATLLPLASFALLLLLARSATPRPYSKSGLGQTIFWIAGGDIPTKVGSYVATAAIGLSCVFMCHRPGHVPPRKPDLHGHEHGALPPTPPAKAKEADHEDARRGSSLGRPHFVSRIGQDKVDFRTGLELTVGYRIDHLGRHVRDGHVHRHPDSSILRRLHGRRTQRA